MDTQLAWITALLSDAEIKYWVDSGTLLGLVRDGKLLDHDRDIDISMWDSDADVLNGLMGEFRKAGYGVRKSAYLGGLCGVKLIPRDCGMRRIDIYIFRRGDRHFWCPLAVGNPAYSKRGFVSMITKEWWAPWKAIGIACWWTFRYVLLRFRPQLISVDKGPWRRVLRLRTWLIPTDVLKTRSYDDQLRVWLPGRVDEYLQYRYGNWMVPTRDWNFLQDDGGLSERSPLELGLHGCRNEPESVQIE